MSLLKIGLFVFTILNLYLQVVTSSSIRDLNEISRNNNNESPEEDLKLSKLNKTNKIKLLLELLLKYTKDDDVNLLTNENKEKTSTTEPILTKPHDLNIQETTTSNPVYTPTEITSYPVELTTEMSKNSSSTKSESISIIKPTEFSIPDNNGEIGNQPFKEFSGDQNIYKKLKNVDTEETNEVNGSFVKNQESPKRQFNITTDSEPIFLTLTEPNSSSNETNLIKLITSSTENIAGLATDIKINETYYINESSVITPEHLLDIITDHEPINLTITEPNSPTNEPNIIEPITLLTEDLEKLATDKENNEANDVSEYSAQTPESTSDKTIDSEQVYLIMPESNSKSNKQNLIELITLSTENLADLATGIENDKTNDVNELSVIIPVHLLNRTTDSEAINLTMAEQNSSSKKPNMIEPITLSTENLTNLAKHIENYEMNDVSESSGQTTESTYNITTDKEPIYLIMPELNSRSNESNLAKPISPSIENLVNLATHIKNTETNYVSKISDQTPENAFYMTTDNDSSPPKISVFTNESNLIELISSSTENLTNLATDTKYVETNEVSQLSDQTLETTLDIATDSEPINFKFTKPNISSNKPNLIELITPSAKHLTGLAMDIKHFKTNNVNESSVIAPEHLLDITTDSEPINLTTKELNRQSNIVNVIEPITQSNENLAKLAMDKENNEASDANEYSAQTPETTSYKTNDSELVYLTMPEPNSGSNEQKSIELIALSTKNLADLATDINNYETNDVSEFRDQTPESTFNMTTDNDPSTPTISEVTNESNLIELITPSSANSEVMIKANIENNDVSELDVQTLENPSATVNDINESSPTTTKLNSHTSEPNLIELLTQATNNPAKLDMNIANDVSVSTVKTCTHQPEITGDNKSSNSSTISSIANWILTVNQPNKKPMSESQKLIVVMMMMFS